MQSFSDFKDYLPQKEKNRLLLEGVATNNFNLVYLAMLLGADANSNNGLAIDWAASNGKRTLVKALIESGADVTAKDKIGMNALMYAAAFRKEPDFIKDVNTFLFIPVP